MRVIAPVALLAALVAAGCGAARQPSAGAHASPAQACGGRATHDFELVPRPGAASVPVRMPAQAGRAPVPLVIAFHAARQSGRGLEGYTGLTQAARRHGLAIAYPTAAGTEDQWVYPPNPGADDVAATAQLIDALGRRACVDTRRVFAIGFSNGGRMTAGVACELAGQLRAIVTVAGGFRMLPPCRPARPISVLVIHGTADQVAIYRGRGPSHDGAVLPYVRAWARRDGCKHGPRARPAGPRVTRLTWSGCKRGTRVEHLRVRGLDHAWPERGDLGGITLSASDAALQFFASISRSQ